jgi:flagellar biosynthesis/type III secretory pathway protein FliH
MVKKIKAWIARVRTPVEGYTREQLEQAYTLGYNDGKRDGLTIAREQATKSLKEILWHQNKDNRR